MWWFKEKVGHRFYLSTLTSLVKSKKKNPICCEFGFRARWFPCCFLVTELTVRVDILSQMIFGRSREGQWPGAREGTTSIPIRHRYILDRAVWSAGTVLSQTAGESGYTQFSLSTMASNSCNTIIAHQQLFLNASILCTEVALHITILDFYSSLWGALWTVCLVPLTVF